MTQRGEGKVQARTDGRARAIVFTVLLLSAGFGMTGVAQRSADAEVTAVKGSACGYITNVGLFGGPQAKLGCEPQSGTQSAEVTPGTFSPSVALPPGGSDTAITAADDGAAAKYGPATIFGGIWPNDVMSAQPSGPISVSTQGTPTGGTVTSFAEIGLHPTPVPVRCYEQDAGTTNCTAPGGFGPPPVWGDTLRVECRASETGVTGSTKFTNAFIATATDAEGSPLDSATQAVPNEPPANYTVSGVITNVGDVFTSVFNEQIVNADGSLTVNAVHMYLFGPTAVGEMIKGQATCGTTPSAGVRNDTLAPSCGTPVVEPESPESPTPKVPRVERVGVFDTGGLQSIANVQVTNGTVRLGSEANDANPDNDYLKFTPGQTGPLPVTATRTDAAEAANLPLVWSFDATDAAGNTTRCVGVTPPPTPTTTTTTTPPSGSTTTVAPGTTTTTSQSSGVTTTTQSSAVTTTTQRSGTTTTSRPNTSTTTEGTSTTQGLSGSGLTPQSVARLALTGSPLLLLAILSALGLVLGALLVLKRGRSAASLPTGTGYRLPPPPAGTRRWGGADIGRALKGLLAGLFRRRPPNGRS